MHLFWLLFIAIFLVILIVVYSGIPWAENKVLFFPSRKMHWSPDDPHMDVYIDVKNPTKVYQHRPKNHHKRYIHGWYFNNYPGHKTVMFCHGNSGNISHRSYIVDICRQFELNLFIFDYRGFGKSSHGPTKRNVRKDGEAAYRFLRDYCHVSPKDIVIWGESLGGIAAIWTASKYRCRSLILLCTFSGLDDTMTYYFNKGIKRSLAYGVSSLASVRYDIVPNRRYIRRVKCPVVIMHSKTDDIIPYDCAKILYKNITHGSKTLITIRGTHSAPIIEREQLREVFSFCDVCLSDYEDVCDVDGILKNLETVAERHHNFMD